MWSGAARLRRVPARGMVASIIGWQLAAGPIPVQLIQEVPVRRTLTASISALALIVVTGACASSGAAPGTTASLPDRLTASEMVPSGATNAYDLIRQLRPRWLQANNTGRLNGVMSQVTLVYVDGHKMGDIDTLRSISSNGIQSMQYLDSVRAATVLTDAGSDPIAGAIMIVTTSH